MPFPNHRPPSGHAAGLLMLALLSLGTPLYAQSGSGIVAGTITDPAKRPLPGATVRGIEAGSEAIAARDGRFVLTGIGTGDHRLVIRYLGFVPETVSVQVTSGRTTHADVSLARPVQQLEAMRVESAVAGQAAALNQQRVADNITSVIDAELVGRLPDRNLAEALGRVPGVALVRDQGEGRFVQIRGTRSSLNTLSIDGVRMPSPSPSTRETPMDVIPSDMVAAIEVNKTLTPDMDADAIGGNVNLVTPSPKSGAPVTILNVAGGQNLINGGLLKNGSTTIGRRFGANDRIGLVLGGNYYQNDRGSQNYEMGWCVETTCAGVPAASALDAPSQLALRDYSQVLRTRYGANATLDYRLDERNTVFAKVFYSKFSDDEQRYVTLANFGSGTYTLLDANHGSVTNARMDKELRLRPVSQEQQSIQLGGRHLLGQGTAIDYTVQKASAREDRPNTLTMVWRQSSMNFTYDVSDENTPKFTATSGAPLDASRYNYNSLRRQARNAKEDENTGRLNVAQPFGLGNVTGIVKLGASARLKDRSSVDSSTRFNTSFRTGAATPTLPITLASLSGPARTYNFIDNRFVFGPQASARAVRDFYESYKGSLTIDTTRSKVETNQGSYELGEDVYAGYAMATFDAGPLRLITGARLERTSQESRGNLVRQQGQVVTITPQTQTRSYTNILPSLTARWSLDDWTTIRGAVTNTLVRPDFGLMAPTVNIPDGNSVVASIGNPGLKPIRATNFDLMVERYFRTVGFVSAGVFHKALSDFIYSEQRQATAEDNLGATVTSVSQSQNSESGKLTGFELAWQQNLPWLPGPLGGMGLNANYTHTTSSTTFPSRQGTTSRLPGQAPTAANLGIFFEQPRVSLRLGYNFADKYLEVIGENPSTDIYVAPRGQLDFSGSVQIMPQTNLFFETNNLTNQPLRRYIGKSERSWQPGNEYYRSWGMIGLRIQPR